MSFLSQVVPLRDEPENYRPLTVSPENVTKAFSASLRSEAMPEEYRALAPRIEELAQVLALDIDPETGVRVSLTRSTQLAKALGVTHKELMKKLEAVYAAQGWKPKKSTYTDPTGRKLPEVLMDDIKMQTVAAAVDKTVTPLLSLALMFYKQAWFQAYKENFNLRAKFFALEVENKKERLASQSATLHEQAERLADYERDVRTCLSFIQRTTWAGACNTLPPDANDHTRWYHIHVVMAAYALNFLYQREAHWRKMFLHALEDLPAEARKSIDISYLTPEEVREVRISCPDLEWAVREQQSMTVRPDLSDKRTWKVSPLPPQLPENFKFSDLMKFVSDFTNETHPLRQGVRPDADIPVFPEDLFDPPVSGRIPNT